MTQTYWHIPKNLLAESIAIMRPHGASGNEGLALWFGNADGSHVNVTHVINVYGLGFRTTPLHMSLSMKAMGVLTDLADQLDAFLVGQIHSHPGRLLDLSELDREHGIRIPNYLSMVCPFYAQRNLRGLDECSAFVFEGHDYRRMSTEEMSRHLLLNNTSVVTVNCKVPL